MNKQIAPTNDEADDFGPFMLACLPKERAFIIAVLNGANYAQAARDAGYGVEGSSSATFARIAHRTLTRPRVVDALMEQMKISVRSLAPEVMRSLRDTLNGGDATQRARVALNLLERYQPTTQRIDAHVTHEIVDHRKDALEQLRAAKMLGASREKLVELFGFSGLPMLERQLEQQEAKQPIDAEFTEVSDIDLEIEAQMKDL
jgi:phage terminase small subunit